MPFDQSMDGVQYGETAKQWFKENNHNMPTFVAIGMQDPVLGKEVMKSLVGLFREKTWVMELGDVGHFVQGNGRGII